MKIKTLFLFLFVALLTQAQRPSIVQPSLKDSNMQLDSIYVEEIVVLNRDNFPSNPIEKWSIKAYDANKNPTEIIVEYVYPVNDSIKYILTHGDLDKSVNTHEHNLGTVHYLLSYNELSDYEAYTNGFDIFNLTYIRAEKYDTTTQQWRPVLEKKFLADLRMPEAYDVSFVTYTYDANNNMITHNNTTSILDSYGYPLEKNVYNYDETIQRKEIFYNTYDSNGRLIETIRNDITDFNTNIEEPYYKYTYSYGTDTFEKISFTYNNSQWIPNQKEVTTYSYYGTPSTENYVWANNQWEFLETQDISGYSYGLFNGYFFSNNSSGVYTTNSSFLQYNDCDLLIQRSYEFFEGYDNGEYIGAGEVYYLFYSSTSTVDCAVNSVEENLLNQITIHPNPAKDKIYINSTENFDYTLYSLQGKLLSKGKFNSQLDVSHLQDGVYILNLTNNTTNVNRKIILKR